MSEKDKWVRWARQDEAETPLDAEYIIALEQAIVGIDEVVDTMHHAPTDISGREEELEAYELYNIIAGRIFAMMHNRWVKRNKPVGE